MILPPPPPPIDDGVWRNRSGVYRLFPAATKEPKAAIPLTRVKGLGKDRNISRWGPLLLVSSAVLVCASILQYCP